jgi:hypothetical protein
MQRPKATATAFPEAGFHSVSPQPVEAEATIDLSHKANHK